MVVAGLVIAIAALAMQLMTEVLKRPRLKIEPSPWLPQTAFPFTFAAAKVYNKPLPRPLNWLSRDVAQACEISIDYYKLDSTEKLFDTVRGRWDNHPQPLAQVLAPPGPDHPDRLEMIGVRYDPSRDSPQEDISVGNDSAQVSAAILTIKDHAFAFGNESYAHLPMFDKPDWNLPKGAYRIVISVRASNLSKPHTERFKLEYYSPDFSKFRLQAL